MTNPNPNPKPNTDPVDLARATVPLDVPGKRVSYSVEDADGGIEKAIKIGSFIALAIALFVLLRIGFSSENSEENNKLIFTFIGGIVVQLGNILNTKGSK